MAQTFTASDVETAAAEQWMAAHRCDSQLAYRALNTKVAMGVEPFVWEFQQTSVACTVAVKCSLCDAREDVSDVASW